MKNLLRPISLAAAFLALASVVHASLRTSSGRQARADPSFDITGGLRGQLRPGGSQPIDLALGNRTRSSLWITDLQVTVAIDDAHVAAGCSADRDFSVAQLPAGVFPIALPARPVFRGGWPARFMWPVPRRWSLGALGVAVQPTIVMRDLAQTNQDACKGATLRFAFTGTSLRARRRAVHGP
jgi:hypothetical protein